MMSLRIWNSSWKYLREVHVSHAQVGALNKYRKVHLPSAKHSQPRFGEGGMDCIDVMLAACMNDKPCKLHMQPDLRQRAGELHNGSAPACTAWLPVHTDSQQSPAILHLSYCAEDIHTMQNLLCQTYAQQNKLDSLLCTAILGCSVNLG